jgi:hypothetical protein
MHRLTGVLLGVAGLVTLASCSNLWPPIADGSIGAVKGKALVADYRLATVQANPRNTIGADGIRNPIICAEPSPDIARAFSSALIASLANVTDKALSADTSERRNQAATLQLTTSQAVAQLGKRYATVQILRDVLHAQCIQYANGAISEATWAALQSQFNSLVVTLFTAEMAGGDGAPNPVKVESQPSATDTSVPTADQFAAVAKAAQGADEANKAFVTAVAKVKAVAMAASAPDDLKKAVAPFDKVAGNFGKANEALQKAWRAVTVSFGSTANDASKTAVSDFKKLVPAEGDKDVAAAADAAASAATASKKASVAGADESKDASDAMTKTASALRAAPKSLDAMLGTKASGSDGGTPNNGTAKPASTSDGADKVGAIAAIQKAYLDKDPIGPSLMACLTYLNPPGPANSASAPDPERDVIAGYCKRSLGARALSLEITNSLLLECLQRPCSEKEIQDRLRGVRDVQGQIMIQ